jgi:hypothetical protein
MSDRDEEKKRLDETGRCAFCDIEEKADALHKAEELGDEEARDEALRAIHEDPLSVMVRDGWREPGAIHNGDGPEEFEILLSTGGPATRIYGRLDEHGQPAEAELQVQDWFIPWTTWRGEGWDPEILLTYARQFYYGD